MTNCKFFFSYARNDKSPYLDNFFEMLREEVMHKTAIKSPIEACFRDTENIDIGNRWTDELSNALQTSRILVCLYTPSYFVSDYCGKEVQIFQSRVAEYKKTKADTPDVILPVLWETPSTFSIPPTLTEIQYAHKSTHKDYPIHGLLTLSKLSKYRNAYKKFVIQLAIKIQEVSKTIELPSVKIDNIALVPSAFESKNNPIEINNGSITSFKQTSIIKSQPGPKQTRVIFAVGVKGEIQLTKKQTENYDNKSEYWKPFYPSEEEIGIISQQVVSDKKLHYTPVNFSENLVEIIRDAEDNNCVAVLVVDPWSAKLEKYKTPISKLDKERFINSAIVVVWNNNDEETNQNKEELYISLYGSNLDDPNLNGPLTRLMIENTTGVKEEIKNIDELKSILSIAIDEARAKLLKRGKPFQTIKADTASMPLLNATGVTTNG